MTERNSKLRSNNGLLTLLDNLQPLDEEFPDIDDGQLPLQEVKIDEPLPTHSNITQHKRT